MQEKWEKFAYIKKFLYICRRFRTGVLRALSLERILWSGLRNVGWSNHSAPIQHPLSIHWDKAERSWKRGRATKGNRPSQNKAPDRISANERRMPPLRRDNERKEGCPHTMRTQWTKRGILNKERAYVCMRVLYY